jgi:hypothetical protein
MSNTRRTIRADAERAYTLLFGEPMTGLSDTEQDRRLREAEAHLFVAAFGKDQALREADRRSGVDERDERIRQRFSKESRTPLREGESLLDRMFGDSADLVRGD